MADATFLYTKGLRAVEATPEWECAGVSYGIVELSNARIAEKLARVATLLSVLHRLVLFGRVYLLFGHHSGGSGKTRPCMRCCQLR
jgi:hypothetical protein